MENFKDINSLSLEYSDTKDILMVGDYRNPFSSLSSSFYSDTTFYHNPYMNQMWSKIKTYRMQKSKMNNKKKIDIIGRASWAEVGYYAKK